jgi:Circadian oscillating protein COP23
MKVNVAVIASLTVFTVFGLPAITQSFTTVEAVWAQPPTPSVPAQPRISVPTRTSTPSVPALKPLPSVPAQTTFHCTAMPGGTYATVAKRGDRQTPPMILWTSTLGEFGQYTPQRRCEIVSDKFTQAVALNGGKLKSMLLTYGLNNRQRVICYVSSQNGSCNSENQLFTLRPADRGRERQILERLVNFGIHGTGTPVQQSGELFYANVGESIERFFADADSKEPATTSPPSPVSIPKPPNTTPTKENSI